MENISELLEIKDKSPRETTATDYETRKNLMLNLFGTESLHDAFSTKFPELCIATVLWMEDKPEGENIPIVRVYPKKENLNICLRNQIHASGIYVYFRQHSNIIWCDSKDKSIYRFDPQFSREAVETEAVDYALKKFLSNLLPEYTYYGNTLSANSCIQGVRQEQRGTLDCFCQEYTLLYAFRRLEGLSHEEAAEDLVSSLSTIREEIRDLYTFLSS